MSKRGQRRCPRFDMVSHLACIPTDRKLLGEMQQHVATRHRAIGFEEAQVLGRISRTLLRIALRRNLFTPVSTSDIKDLDTLAALLEVDTNYGRWQKR